MRYTVIKLINRQRIEYNFTNLFGKDWKQNTKLKR